MIAEYEGVWRLIKFHRAASLVRTIRHLDPYELTGVMGLHSLKGVDKYSATLEINSLLCSLDGSLHGAARPEGMAHGTPGVLGIGSKVCRSILADDEARRGAGECQVHQAVLIDCRFEGVGVSVFVEGQREVVGSKREHALIEHVVIQGVGMPVMLAVAIEVEDLRVELGRSMDASGQVNRDGRETTAE